MTEINSFSDWQKLIGDLSAVVGPNISREVKREQRQEREADAAMLRLWHAEADAGMLDEFRAKHTPVVVSPAVGGA